MEFICVTDPSDWPLTMPELKTIDTLLRCGICYEFYDIAMMIPQCSHNYCSVCIRRYLTYKSQCPSCNTSADASKLCSNRALDELVANFKAVRPHILKLCREDAKKNGEDSPVVRVSSPHQVVGDLRKGKKKASPFRVQQENPDSDGDFQPSHQAAFKTETPRRKLQKRSSYKDTRERIASQAACEEPSHEKNDGTFSCGPSVEQTSSSASSSISSPPQKSPRGLNRSNEENIDPTYQPVSADDESDSDGDNITVATPSKPSTSHGQTSSTKDVTPATRSEKVDCPVCGVPISSKHINTHLDGCLTRSEEKEKRKKVATRKPLPKMVFTLLTEKELRKKLKEYGLNTKGQRPVLIKRLNDFTLMYNAQCDSANPIPVDALVKEFNRVEKLKTQPSPNLPDQRLKVSRSQTEEEISKGQQDYLKTHGSHFQDLIKNVKQRMKGKSKKASGGAADGKQLSDGESTSVTSSSQSSSGPPEDADVSGISVSVEMAEEESVGGGDNDPRGENPFGKPHVSDIRAADEASNDCVVIVRDEEVHESDLLPDDAAGCKQSARSDRLRIPLKECRSHPPEVSSEREQYTASTNEGESAILNANSLLSEESAPLAARLESNTEEQMDLTEDDVSPVFGRCSGGSRDGETKAPVSDKIAELSVKLNFEGKSSPAQKQTASSLVPPPPSLLLLNDTDRISEGSSIGTPETMSETSESHGDPPSPPSITCIPESPGRPKEASRPKKLGRRKRKPEALVDDCEGSGGARMTRSRKRGKTSAT